MTKQATNEPMNLSGYKVKRVHSEQMPAYDELFGQTSTLVVQANMGIGKTVALLEYIKSLPADSCIIWLSFRQTYTDDILARCNKNGLNFVSYQDNKQLHITNNSRYIIQIESLHKLSVADFKNQGITPELIILDESESLVAQLSSGLHGKHYSVNKSIMFALIEHANKVIAMDANISGRTLALLKSRNDIRPNIFLQNSYSRSTDKKIVVHDDKNTWRLKLIQYLTAGKKVFIPTNSKTELSALVDVILKEQFNMIEGVDYKIFDSDTSAAIKHESLKDVNTDWCKYKVLGFSPTISAGVSFEQLHFDVSMPFMYGKSCDAIVSSQMIGRVRQLTDNTMHMYLDTKAYGMYRSREDIARQFLSSSISTIAAELDNLAYTLNSDWSKSPLDRTEAELIIYNAWFSIRSLSGFAREMTNIMLRAGYKMEMYNMPKERPEMPAVLLERPALMVNHISQITFANDLRLPVGENHVVNLPAAYQMLAVAAETNDRVREMINAMPDVKAMVNEMLTYIADVRKFEEHPDAVERKIEIQQGEETKEVIIPAVNKELCKATDVKFTASTKKTFDNSVDRVMQYINEQLDDVSAIKDKPIKTVEEQDMLSIYYARSKFGCQLSRQLLEIYLAKDQTELDIFVNGKKHMEMNYEARRQEFSDNKFLHENYDLSGPINNLDRSKVAELYLNILGYQKASERHVYRRDEILARINANAALFEKIFTHTITLFAKNNRLVRPKFNSDDLQGQLRYINTVLKYYGVMLVNTNPKNKMTQTATYTLRKEHPFNDDYSIPATMLPQQIATPKPIAIFSDEIDTNLAAEEQLGDL